MGYGESPGVYGPMSHLEWYTNAVPLRGYMAPSLIGANIFSYRATAKCSLTLPASAVTSGA